MRDYGDFLASGSVDMMFTTIDPNAGTASTMSGGSIVVYKNNGTVESGAGVTLTADFDARTGLNHVGINLAADASFYAPLSNFNVVIAQGTVTSVSIASYTIGSFSVENRNHKPTGGTVATVSGNVSGSVAGGVLSAGTITNPIAVRAGTVDLVTAAGTVNNPLAVYAGTVNVAGTVTNAIAVRAGTVDVAGTVTSAILVRGGTVAEATALTATERIAIRTSIFAEDVAGTDYLAGSFGEDFQAILGYTAQIPNDPAEAVIKKNVAYNNFTFMMFDTSGDPATGKTVTAQRSIDGAAFGACANSVSEISAGWYKINLAAADLNGDNIALKFTATGCEPTNISILPES